MKNEWVCSSIPPFRRMLADFDQIYRTFITPAILDAGLSPLTAEEFNSGAIIHRAALEAVIGAYAFIADISTANPNVMYELGIRHALRRGLTVLLNLA